MDRGWVKIYRKVADNVHWKADKFTRGQAWIDLILLANHKPGHIRIRGLRVEVARGQVGWSEVRLAERWKWGRGKVRKFLLELVDDKMIVQQKTLASNLITIINYDKHQGDDTPNSTPNGQQTVHQTVHQTDTNKNEKNVKNEKKKETYTLAFLNFYNNYPRKKSKHEAQKAWTKLKPDTELIEKINKDVQARQQDRQWEEGFIPHPSTYLNQRIWEDDIEGAESSQEERREQKYQEALKRDKEKGLL